MKGAIMNLYETTLAKGRLDRSVARLKLKVEDITRGIVKDQQPWMDHKPPVTAVRWEKLSGPEMDAISQLLNAAHFIINNPPQRAQSLYCENEMVHGKKGGAA